jgi:glycosyltransferase involved in cell wall biosynthesis
MTVTVSILVTVYNRQAYLARTLESILASSYQDYEVLIVDDCSTDQSLAIAREIAAMDSRLAVHANPQNLGDYPNRMRAASLARGKYLKYVDSDDLLYPHSLGVMVAAMQQYPSAALGIGHSRPEDDEPYPWLLSPQQAYHKHFLQSGCLSSGPSAAIIRRDAFESCGGFRDWGVLNDNDLWFRLAARWPVCLLPPGLVWWRRHETQEFRSGNAAQAYLENGFHLKLLALQSESCPLPEQDRQAAIARLSQHHARRLLALGLKGKHPLEAWRLFRRAGLSCHQLLSGLRRYQ